MKLNFILNSPIQLRYENGRHVSGPQGSAGRAVKVEPNISGCEGYNIIGGEGYIVTIFNLDGNHPIFHNNVQVTPKPMKIVSQSKDKIVLRGYRVKAMTPIGWIDFNGSDYGLSIFLKENEIIKCIFHLHDRNVDIEYLTDNFEDKTSQIDFKKKLNLIDNYVNEIIKLHKEEDIEELQEQLHNLYSMFNKPGGGKLLTSYSHKDRLGECFLYLLEYDWMFDDDILEVYAENGFYCITLSLIDLKSEKQLFFNAYRLFLLLFLGSNHLFPKIKDLMEIATINTEIFSDEDILKGPNYLIDQFKYFAAKIIWKILLNDGRVSQEIRADLIKSANSSSFEHLNNKEILRKAVFLRLK
ncbi:MAG: hypothetical protein IPP06_05410 [Saprospiraceae bacterium]|nr:hypothetical protein [Candidatus Vicinibacter affinis]